MNLQVVWEVLGRMLVFTMRGTGIGCMIGIGEGGVTGVVVGLILGLMMGNINPVLYGGWMGSAAGALAGSLLGALAFSIVALLQPGFADLDLSHRQAVSGATSFAMLGIVAGSLSGVSIAMVVWWLTKTSHLVLPRTGILSFTRSSALPLEFCFYGAIMGFCIGFFMGAIMGGTKRIQDFSWCALARWTFPKDLG